MLALSVTQYEIFAIEMCITLTRPLECAERKCRYANRKATHDFLFDDNSSVCSVSHHLRDTRKPNKIPKVWPWRWRSRLRRGKPNVRHSTDNVQFYIRDFFQNFSYPATCVYAKGNTHPHLRPHTHARTHARTHTHIQRQTGVLTKGIICNAYLPDDEPIGRVL